MIPLFSPVRQNSPFLSDALPSFEEFLRGGRYVLGPEVEKFEVNLAQNLGFGFATGCASGMEGLVLAIRALGLPSDSFVMTPAFSFVASTNAILWAGLKPLFVDVEPESLCIDCNLVEKLWNTKVKAIIAVDLFGHQADIERLRAFCNENKIALIEDGAQSMGVSNLKPDFFVTSFYPTKVLGAMGDAGAVLSDNKEALLRVKAISRHGGLERDHYLEVGTTGRLDTFQALLLNLKLPMLRTWIQERKSMAQRFLQRLGSFPDLKIVQGRNESIWSLFTLRSNRRDELMGHLQSKGVGAAVYYPRAIPDQPSMELFSTGDYSVSRKAAEEVLSIPFYPELTVDEQETVLSAIQSFYGS